MIALQNNIDYTTFLHHQDEHILYSVEDNMMSYHLFFFKKNAEEELQEQVC